MPIVQDYMLPMLDGVKLYTRVVLPGTGQYPVVFMRTPYETETFATDSIRARYESDDFIRRGYAVVLQHCRGRNGSEGICIPYADEERRDGLHTVVWIRKQPFYDGELFFSGGSYTATVLLMMLGDDLPDLKALAVTQQTESMYHRNYFNGMCRSFCGFSWWLSMMSGQYPTIADEADIYKRPYRDMMKRAVGRDIPSFTEGLLHNRFDTFWKDDPRIGTFENLKIPVLFTGGWYDYYCYGMCAMWEKLPAETRKKSCFLMTPFGHGLKAPSGSDYPLGGGCLPKGREGAWFDHVRKGSPFPFAEVGTFRYYMIAKDTWMTAESPYEETPSYSLYLTEDGALSERPAPGGSASFRYDPDHPKHHDRQDGMYACEPDSSREDVLTFMGKTFSEEQAFFGPVRFDLTVNSDCDDTAFFMRLYLVENGKSYQLADGVTTLLYQDPNRKRNMPLSFTVTTQPTAFTVKKGSALRVDISSWSDSFVPHANTSTHFALETKPRIATNTVCFGNSRVLLPEMSTGKKEEK